MRRLSNFLLPSIFIFTMSIFMFSGSFAASSRPPKNGEHYPRYYNCWGAFSPDGTKICWGGTTYWGADDEIWVMNPDGSKPLKLGTNIGNLAGWLDNEHLLLWAEKNLYLFDIKKNEKNLYVEMAPELEKGEDIAAYSDDFSKIVAEREKRKGIFRWELRYFVIDLHTSERVELESLKQVGWLPISHSLCLSPDGSMLIFADEHNVYSINANGSGFKCLTENVEEIAQGGEIRKGVVADPAVFSPSGNLIAFTTEKALFVMERDGSNLRKIFEHKEWKMDIGGPKFTPDGKRIIFPVSREPYGYCYEYIVNIDGTGLKKLFKGMTYNVAITFSPNNGENMLFQSGRQGATGKSRALWSVNLDGTNLKQIFPLPKEMKKYK